MKSRYLCSAINKRKRRLLPDGCDKYKAAAFAFQSLARLPKDFNSDISLLHNNSFLIQEEEVARSGVLLFAFSLKSFRYPTALFLGNSPHETNKRLDLPTRLYG